MKFIIKGLRTISKKNNHVGSSNRFFITSKAYKRFEREAQWQIKEQWNHHVFSTPFEMNVLFEMKGKLDTDLDNMYTSLLDVLQSLGVISNDKLLVKGSMSKTHGHKDFQTVIELEEIIKHYKEI